MISESNIVETKRSRKPKVQFVPEDPRILKRFPSTKRLTKPARNRNEAAGDNGQINKWDNYRMLIKRSLQYYTKETHYLELYTQESKMLKENDKELQKIQTKIQQLKQTIVSTLQALDAENAEYKRWPQLTEADEDDMVEVADIMCSVCNQEETETNDILLCDKDGCYRAYHQLCLNPPLSMASFDPNQDWFCWQCECMDDCLDMLSERLDLPNPCTHWKDVFPDILQEAIQKIRNENTIMGAILPDEDEDEMDDEYAPTYEEMIVDEREEWEDASIDNDDDEEDDDDDEEEEEEEEEVEDGIGDDNDDDDQGREGRETLMLSKLQAIDNGHYIPPPCDDDNDDNDNENAMIDDDDDEDEEGDNDSDREGDGEGEYSALPSEIDEDEVNGLLQDAEIDYHEIALHHINSSSSSSTNTRKLRDRSKKQSTIIRLYGKKDIDRSVAQVRRGVFVVGKVIDYQPSMTSSTNNDNNSTNATTIDVSIYQDNNHNNNDAIIISHKMDTADDTVTLLSTEKVEEAEEVDTGIWTVQYDNGIEVTYDAAELRYDSPLSIIIHFNT
jgi:hypothetical protein